MFHDVGWPHARRDTYYAPDRIPEEHRQPLARNTGLTPGEPGVDPARAAVRIRGGAEGGPRNGVLTAIEDFMDRGEGLRLGRVPAFFGFGVLWARDAPYGRGGLRDPRPVRRQPGPRPPRGQPGRAPGHGAFARTASAS